MFFFYVFIKFSSFVHLLLLFLNLFEGQTTVQNPLKNTRSCASSMHAVHLKTLPCSRKVSRWMTQIHEVTCSEKSVWFELTILIFLFHFWSSSFEYLNTTPLKLTGKLQPDCCPFVFSSFAPQNTQCLDIHFWPSDFSYFGTLCRYLLNYPNHKPIFKRNLIC